MEVVLSPFFAGAACVLVDSTGAELLISRAFAGAANVCYDVQQPQQPWSEPRPQHGHAPMTVKLLISTPMSTWSRQAKDVVLRCVDRAVTRIFPPLDVLQYISADSPAFVDADADVICAGGPSQLSVVFFVQPSATLWPASLLKPHAVEGEIVSSPQLNEPEVCSEAVLQSMHDTLSDMDLWNRARAAHQRYDASFARDGGQQHSGCGLVSEATSTDITLALQAERQASDTTTQLQWQLARWLTELFLNEGSWARSQTAPSVGTSKSPQKFTAEAGTRHLFQGSLRLLFPHVVGAALSAQHTSPRDASPSSAVPRRFLHADVRGVEWDGLLVGYTSRYAYVAVPHFVVPAETAAASGSSSPCLWSFVSRIPIPSILSRSNGSGAEDHRVSTVGLHRKRPRTSGLHHPNSTIPDDDIPGSTTAREVLAHCFNKDEVMRHERHPEAVFRLADTPYVVTVRSHRIYCARADPAKQPCVEGSMSSPRPFPTTPQAAVSPHTLSLVLEDAYAVRVRSALDSTSTVPTTAASSRPIHWAASLLCGCTQQQCSEDEAGNESHTGKEGVRGSVAHEVHTFLDVVSVVRESCHRFQRTHERFFALYEECIRVRSLTTSTTAVRADTNTACPSANGLSSTTTQAGVATEIKPVGETAGTRGSLSPTVAAQSLRLLRQAEVLYSALSDSISVHFKKLRGAARVPIPVVRTVMDVAQLEEGHHVEFKAKVVLVENGSSSHSGSQRQHHPVLMDTERLRNTMSAMAACRGGVILIGVTDDGRILGHAKQLDVARQLRTSGFCPAMVKDTVQVKELRWLGNSSGAPGVGETDVIEGSENAPPLSAKRVMPPNWWKGCATAATSDLPRACAVTKTGPPASDQVITVVSVQKGQAPFYAASKNSPPYQRGCASTITMPTIVMARRVMKELS